jgi:hypothetical protein
MISTQAWDKHTRRLPSFWIKLKANIRLLRIEMRRNVGLLLCPLLIVLSAALAMSRLPRGVWIWPHTSIMICETLMLLGPFMAALAAWMAARNRRCRMDELLATTPHPPTARDLTVWGGTAVWGLLAYLAVAVGLIIVTAQRATWGVPLWAPIIQGALGLIAYVALGYAVGYYVPSRFTAPLVAMGMYILQYLPILWYESSLLYLMPLKAETPSIYYPTEPNLGVPKALWLLGLAAIGVTAIVLKERQTLARWSAMFLAFLATMAGATMVLYMAPSRLERSIIPYEPVCAEGRIEVCVHPAYKAVLPDTVAIANAVVQPVLGIPGGPTRVEQGPGGGELLPNGTLTFDMFHAPTYDPLPLYLAQALVLDPDAVVGCDDAGPCYPESQRVQDVISAWSTRQSGFKQGGILDADGQAALDRFMALDSAAQRHWLEANYAALRAGKLTLEDLP